MMTIIYPFEHNDYMKKNPEESEHVAIYQRFKNGDIKQTHKRVTYDEFYHLPKVMCNKNNTISIVTGNQTKGGLEYVRHLKNRYHYAIDRVNQIIILEEKQR